MVEPVVEVIDGLHRGPLEGHGAEGVLLDGSGDCPVAVDRALLAAPGGQVVDDADGSTIAAASTLEPAVKGAMEQDAKGGNVAGAKFIGRTIAERLIEKGVTRVVFDRNGFLYHGRVKAVADAAREAGLEF